VWCPGGGLSAVRRQVELLGMDRAAPGDRPETQEQLFWFRWIVGNQVVTALWQVLDAELGLVLSGGNTAATRNAVALLDGYSALLVYAGSPPRGIYHRLIRPAMAFQHRAFSGRWAQDYVPVMTKLHAVRSAGGDLPGPEHAAVLVEAWRRNQRAHVAVAAKLVPGEASLLRANGGSASGTATETTTLLYDAFYSTVRAPVSRETVVEQLLHRLRAVQRDLLCNGLYPAGCDSRAERPDRLWRAELQILEGGLPKALRGTGDAAAAALRAAPDGRAA